MIIDNPTYLISELAGDVVALVEEMRERFNPNHDWPVDITIAGSSGIGTIKEGQDISVVIEAFQSIITSHGFTEVTFISASRFPNTGIYYLAPECSSFDVLHKAIAGSEIQFNENKWPYNPHCTLRAGIEPTDESDLMIKSMSLPKNSIIECFSLYQPFSGGGRVHRF